MFLGTCGGVLALCMEPSTSVFLTGRVENRKQRNVLKMSEYGQVKCQMSTQWDIVETLNMRATKKTRARKEFMIGCEMRRVDGTHAILAPGSVSWPSACARRRLHLKELSSHARTHAGGPPELSQGHCSQRKTFQTNQKARTRTPEG